MTTLDPTQWYLDPEDDSFARPPIDAVVWIARAWPGNPRGARYRVRSFGPSKAYGVLAMLVEVSSGAVRYAPVRALHLDRTATERLGSHEHDFRRSNRCAVCGERFNEEV